MNLKKIIFNKKLLKEKELEIIGSYESIPYASVVRFIDNPISKRKTFEFNDRSDRREIINIFIPVILNLVLTKTIKVKYTVTKTELLFGLFNFKSDNFSLSIANSTYDSRDVLTRDVFFILKSIQSIEEPNLKVLISNLISNYIGLKQYKNPNFVFLEKYLSLFKEENNWLRYIPNYDFMGIHLSVEIQFEEQKQNEISIWNKRLKQNHFNEMSQNLLFKNFIHFLESTISSDIQRRIPSD